MPKDKDKGCGKDCDNIKYVRRRRGFTTLRSRMVLYVFFAMTITISVALSFVLILVTNGIIARANPLLPILFIGLASMAIGTMMAFIIYNYVFHGFDDFLKAMSRVSKGDFEVKMPESENYLNEMYDSFNKMVQSLKSIETLKTDFISNFSHEFKTPIASICGFAKLLKNPELSREEREEFINIIITESNRLTYLAQNTLSLSKLENQEQVFEQKAYSLDEQIRKCALLFQTELEDKEIDFDINEDEITYYGNEALMSQLWINLISNAIKFTPRHGSITVRAKNEAGTITVSVSDSGCGMDGDTKNRIFEKFYQGEESHTGAGNGLGLSIAKKIVEIAKGKISVESEIGAGSTFTVTLPVVKPAVTETK